MGRSLLWVLGLLVLITLFAPAGLAGLLSSLWRRLSPPRGGSS